MGVSTDAILFYGFSFYDAEEGLGEPPPWEDEEGRSGSWSAWFYSADDEIVERVKALGVDIDSHCSGDFPIYFIYVKELKVTAHRGYPKEIDMQELKRNIGVNADMRLRKACEWLGIPFEQPKWWLASYWG